jgi:hypothetical protein
MRTLHAMVLLLIVAFSGSAAGPVTGDWVGVIKIKDVALRLVVHITDSGKGLQATFDSVDRKVLGMPVDKIEVKGQQLRFEIAVIQSVYTGTLNKMGTAVTGAWSQLGMSFPVDFRKTAPAKK